MTTSTLNQRNRQSEKTRTPSGVAHFDCWKNATEVVLQGDFPGIDPPNLVIEFHEGTLSISGSAKDVPAAGASLLHEFDRSPRERSFKLHEEIDADRIKASFQDAVLTLVLPIVQPAQPRRIPVTGE
jgi:HSP20 family protein